MLHNEVQSFLWHTSNSGMQPMGGVSIQKIDHVFEAFYAGRVNASLWVKYGLCDNNNFFVIAT